MYSIVWVIVCGELLGAPLQCPHPNSRPHYLSLLYIFILSYNIALKISDNVRISDIFDIFCHPDVSMSNLALDMLTMSFIWNHIIVCYLFGNEILLLFLTHLKYQNNHFYRVYLSKCAAYTLQVSFKD